MSLRQQRKAFQDVIERYLGQLGDLSQDEDASNELSLRPALDTFIKGLSTAFDRDNMSVITEPIRQSYGTPDYKLKTDKGFLIGYIEAKGLTKELDDLPERDAEQVERYRDAGKRFVLTNHRDFWLYDYASDGRTVMLRDQVTLLSKSDVEQGRQPKEADVDALHRLLDRFLRDARPDINTPEQLAERLAASARHLCDELRKAYDAEGESGHLHDLKQAFEEILIPDIDRDQFTDMYAQTLTYGLFAAAVNHQDPELLNLDNAWRDIPKTNRFLRRLFESVTGSALEDKPYKWIIEDLLDLFNGLDMMAILEGFGQRAVGQDPIVHFYEDFLAAYDPELREKRGVYYTPEPVVSFIVRSVDHLLKKRFGCPEGLADHQKITHSVKRNGEEVEEESHKVLVLDPACGTGTFLYFVIDLIRQRFMERGEAGMWSDYVSDHLLPRIFGFELLMAPYAMAHLKLGLQLAGHDLEIEQREEWSHSLPDEERLGVYLTNTLEESIPRQTELWGPMRILTEEANAAADVKRQKPVLVVLGNPPYSNYGQMNVNDWIQSLLSDYKQGLNERKLNLDDDFIKFIRWGQWRIEQTSTGILAFITNNTYLNGITHRRMRETILDTFTDLYLLNLHGDIRKKEMTPEGNPDENVFDITRGVAISILVRDPNRNGTPNVYYYDLWGDREGKYGQLANLSIDSIPWESLYPEKKYFFFIPYSNSREQDYYEKTTSVSDIMPENGSGFTTHRDAFIIDIDGDTLKHRIDDFFNLNIATENVKQKYSIKNYRSFDIESFRTEKSMREDAFIKCLYRPFDKRWTYYDRLIVQEWQYRYQRQMLESNLALVAMRQVSIGYDYSHIFVTDSILNDRAMLSTRGRANLFPLYLLPSEEESETGVARSRISEEYRKAEMNNLKDPDSQSRIVE